ADDLGGRSSAYDASWLTMASRADSLGTATSAPLLGGVEGLADDGVHDPGQPVLAEGGGAACQGAGDLAVAARVAFGGALVRLDRGGDGRAAVEVVTQLPVDGVDQGPVEGQRV